MPPGRSAWSSRSPLPSAALPAAAPAATTVPATSVARARGARIHGAVQFPLAHPDPRIRRAAGKFFTPTRCREARDRLFAALAREGDGYAFSCLHQSLQVLSGKQVLLLAGEEDDHQARARIVREWKEKLSS